MGSGCGTRGEQRPIPRIYGRPTEFHVGDAVSLVQVEQRLNDIMRSFEEDGCVLNNPHIFKLEDGGRFDPDGRKLAFRKSVDPTGLLNPGKLRSLS